MLAHDALADGTLVEVSSITLPGYGFLAVPRPEAERSLLVQNFVDWLAKILQQDIKRRTIGMESLSRFMKLS